MSETPHTFAVGDRVICNPAETSLQWQGIVWTVEKVHRVNVDLRAVDGTRRLRIDPAALLPAPADGAPATATVVDLPFYPTLPMGTVVTVASPRWKGGNGLFVVIDDRGDTAKIVALGGNDFKYWPKVQRAWLTEVDKDALLAATASLRPQP